MTDRFSHKLADNSMVGMSGLFIIPSVDTYDIVRVPKYSLVSDIWLDVVVACTAGATITIGWKGNGETAQVAGFMSSDIAKPLLVGLKRAQKDNLVSFPGKYFSGGSGAITVTVGGTALAAGQFRVLCAYTIIQ